MQSLQRVVIVNEDDNRKNEVYTDGDVDATPSGIGMFAKDPTTTLRILRTDNLGNLCTNVQVGGLGGSVAVYFSPATPSVAATFAGTMAVYFDQSEPTIKASGKDGTTTRPLKMNSDGAIKVYDLANGTVSISNAPSITGITNSIAVHILSTNGTMGVRFSDEPYVVAEGKYGAVKVPLLANTEGALKIYDIANGTVQVSSVAGIVNVSHTASVASAGGSVSGSTSGVSTSGVQLVSPIVSRVTKVYAFSITTTAQTQIVPKFTDGSGAAPTELWRAALQAPAQGISGVNLAVSPPGYLFATPSGATLCIVNDSGSLIHYSIAYFRETA